MDYNRHHVPLLFRSHFPAFSVLPVWDYAANNNLNVVYQAFIEKELEMNRIQKGDAENIWEKN